ncbi:lipoprotein insertase outer membrane protein LolB [Glaciimonas soli]|uniref:Outer-membrane lipoprotein LolB n=1 Tax=Glaciimonas soli TaxID=2590999 RepID=A0A843YKL5_9BURK|nr:lipoprotein insertase outer membrane protein LolB [Glaciimonas soli]MQR00369.1 outer membrane lipoprotein LolB [Glaciimonas soli]
MHFLRKSATMATITIAALFSAGCSSLSTSPAHISETTPAIATTAAMAAPAQRPYYKAIDLGGRLSVRYEQNGKEQAVYGSFTWSQTLDHTVVTLLSPLGQTLATINITPDLSTLQQAGQPIRTAADVDQLTSEALGWPLPIAGMRDWLQAFGNDSKDQRFNLNPTSDSSAVTSVTTSDHWLIQYTNWQTGTDNSGYAKRIDLSRNTEQAGPVAIRIVIDNWQPH